MLLKTDPATSVTNGSQSKTLTHLLTKTLLRTMAATFNLRPGLKKYLKTDAGWFDFTVGIRTESRSVETAIRFRGGKVGILKEHPR